MFEGCWDTEKKEVMIVAATSVFISIFASFPASSPPPNLSASP